jgi:hypothetical protein
MEDKNIQGLKEIKKIPGVGGIFWGALEVIVHILSVIRMIALMEILLRLLKLPFKRRGEEEGKEEVKKTGKAVYSLLANIFSCIGVVTALGFFDSGVRVAAFLTFLIFVTYLATLVAALKAAGFLFFLIVWIIPTTIICTIGMSLTTIYHFSVPLYIFSWSVCMVISLFLVIKSFTTKQVEP